MDTYILKGKKPVPEYDYRKWADWMSKNNRVVKQTEVATNVSVSTVFLGIDYDENEPLLFETMIFGGHRHEECFRYSTWDEAIDGHNKIVAEFHHRCKYCGTLRRSDEVKCFHCNGPF